MTRQEFKARFGKAEVWQDHGGEDIPTVDCRWENQGVRVRYCPQAYPQWAVSVDFRPRVKLSTFGEVLSLL